IACEAVDHVVAGDKGTATDCPSAQEPGDAAPLRSHSWRAGSDTWPVMPDLLAGRSIRQYQLMEPLGDGGFGTVYRARHRDLRIDRAFKVLRETLSLEPDVRARFLQEAQAAAHLRHPNIVPVYDVFDEHGLLCIVMELVDSWTLADRIR